MRIHHTRVVYSQLRCLPRWYWCTVGFWRFTTTTKQTGCYDHSRCRKLIKDTWQPGQVWVSECFFWYRLTRVVSDKGLLNGCFADAVVVAVHASHQHRSSSMGVLKQTVILIPNHNLPLYHEKGWYIHNRRAIQLQCSSIHGGLRRMAVCSWQPAMHCEQSASLQLYLLVLSTSARVK